MHTHTRLGRRLACLLALPIAATACREDPARVDAEREPAAGFSASAGGSSGAPLEIELEGRSGSELAGVATLESMPEGVRVTIELDRAPDGLHGVHVHARADCSAEDASSAGGHFAPRGRAHGLPSDPEHHLGDLGNLQVRDGRGTLRATAPGATLEPGDASSFLGRAIVVHAQRDSGEPPAGEAGSRIGCGELPDAV